MRTVLEEDRKLYNFTFRLSNKNKEDLQELCRKTGQRPSCILREGIELYKNVKQDNN